VTADVRSAVEAWIADDPDPASRAELQALVRSGDEAALRDRFADRIRQAGCPFILKTHDGRKRVTRVVITVTCCQDREFAHEQLSRLP